VRALNVVRLPSSAPVKLDDGPKTAALVQREIFRSGWSYTRIAMEAGVCISTVHHLASGETKRPQMRSVMLILAALGWEVYASERRG
jgi:hypothetical protein